ncbi:HAD hydrolase-like protein [uncultured Bifidobacterium sp.]|uniref:HAD hydrolase-like protein n=1 Tax=uncultured Bifidobacterium sp. TaxID=165187 RepID=UPI0037DD10FC
MGDLQFGAVRRVLDDDQGSRTSRGGVVGDRGDGDLVGGRRIELESIVVDEGSQGHPSRNRFVHRAHDVPPEAHQSTAIAPVRVEEDATWYFCMRNSPIFLNRGPDVMPP